jgi:acetylornithine/succinyldiaminopimelate/putrescine aminotransferase
LGRSINLRASSACACLSLVVFVLFQVRGLGLLVGVQLDFMAGPIVEAARAAGVLIITAGG